MNKLFSRRFYTNNFISAICLTAFLLSIVSAKPVELQRLADEPTMRIGLTTNARSVAISTNDSQLTSISPNEPSRFLATTKVSVTARAYRPPEITIYNIEIAGITTQAEAEQSAKDLRESLQENVVTVLDSTTTTWKIKVGDDIDTLDEANALKESLSEQGFDDASIVTKTVKQPSNDAVALSQAKSNSSVSNLILSRPTNANISDESLINPTVLSNPATVAPEIVQPEINSNLREVIVRGAGFASSFSSLKPVAFGSTNERSVPVRVNGKAYRGRIEVFVNERGNLTVVNVVKIEDYLRGVVPNELGLPALEAQKAQAVAARTYAIKNIGQFGKEGFDILPTTRSQVYRGYSSENSTATQAVEQTKGIVATYDGKPINAMYTSTCGGRTENVENIYDFAEPYLRGVECSLEGREQFQTLLIKSNRELPKIERDENIELTRNTALLAINNWQISTNRFSDDYFSDSPNENELRAWLNAIAGRLNQPFPQNVTSESAKPANLANILGAMLYSADYADILLSASDVNYQLSFADGDKVPATSRANTAILLRDGWLSLYSDATLRPEKPLSRARLFHIIQGLGDKKKWFAPLQSGVTKSSADGKLVLKSGKSEKVLTVKPDVYLFRQFGDAYFQMKEIALVGGESVNYHTNLNGEVDYLEVKPTTATTTAERTSSFSLWNVNLSSSAVQSRLSRYVRGIGNLYDVKISKRGVSRRAIELEIIGSNGVKTLKGGKIRSALRLNEQLFVMNKRYGANGNVVSYNFTGRGWGHGIGMCQYGAFGMAKLGLKYDAIIKHYYTGVDLTKSY